MRRFRTFALAVVTLALVVVAFGHALIAPPAHATSSTQTPAWEPTKWVGEDTIELRTTAPGEKPHWFKVWFVVIDGELYVRLGERATKRIESNETKPVIAVRIAGHEFPSVEGVPAPEMEERVAEAMADKHVTDVFVRWMDHPLTLRLKPR
jgi:hypothetical protein